MAYHSPKSVERMRDCMDLQISQTEKVNLTMPFETHPVAFDKE